MDLNLGVKRPTVARRFTTIAGYTLICLSIAFVGTASAYWFGSIASRWYPSLFTALGAPLLGAYLFSTLPFKSRVAKILSTLIYGVSLFAIVWVLGFLTACMHGDCV